MRAYDALQDASKILRANNIKQSMLEAEFLLTHVLKKSKEYILAQPEMELPNYQRRHFFILVRRRAGREPLAYIVGHKEFYGLDFKVNRRVLIPRPETEILVNAVLNRLRVTNYQLPVTIVDIGTGSGAIAIALAKKIKDLRLKIKAYATDISPAALRVARQNARRHGITIHFLHDDLIKSVPKRMKHETWNMEHLVITANLPYLPTHLWRKTQPEIKKYEPRRALDGGKDGLKYYRALMKQIRRLTSSRQNLKFSLFLEFDPGQTARLCRLARNHFPTARVEIKKDIANHSRVMIINCNL